VFAEIFVTTGGGPGLQTTNIAFLIYSQALIQYDVGTASAGGLIAVIIANIVAFFLVRIVGRNLEARGDGATHLDDPQAHRDTRRMDRRHRHLLPDPVDGADQLQNRARGLLDAARFP